MVPDLRPWGIGEILDASVVLYRKRFGQLVRYSAIAVVPVQLLLMLVLLSAQPDRFSLTLNGSATPQLDTTRAQLGATAVVFVVGILTHAFVAAVGIASMRDLGISDDIVNVNGGAIALGHPIGMSGTRVVMTLINELRRRGGGVGAAALCGGGGQGDAAIIRTL